SKLDDAQERAGLAKVFEQGLQKVVGYVLPLRVGSSGKDETQWESGPWFLRPERMYLTPGDSPIGFRLPLESLPWSPPGDHSRIFQRDPLDERGALPRFSSNGSAGHGGWPPHWHGRAGARRRQLVHQVAGVSGQSDAAGNLEDKFPESAPVASALS